MTTLYKLCVLALAAVLLQCCVPASGAPILDQARISEQTLDNGLHVVVKHDPHWGIVSFGLCIKASPLYETEKQRGLADVVRHMAVDAPSEQQPIPLSGRLRDMGVEFSAYTSPDGTQIAATSSSQDFPEVLSEVAKAVFEPTIEEQTWAKELQKLRRLMMDRETSPLGKLWSTMWDTAFRSHPYRYPVAGGADAIAAHNAESIRQYHTALYVPNNTSLIVVGDVAPQTVFELARTCFGGYQAGPLSLPQVTPEPAQTDSRTRLEKARGSNTIVCFGWHAAGIDKKLDVCALDLIFAVLNEGRQARLMKAFTSKATIGGVPEVEFITKRDPGLFLVTCITAPQHEFDSRDLVLKEIERLHNEVLSEADLRAAKDLIHAGYAFDNADYGSQVGSMCFYEAIDSYRFAADYTDIVETVTAEDIQRVARQYLGLSNYSLVIIRPKAAGSPVWEANLTP